MMSFNTVRFEKDLPNLLKTPYFYAKDGSEMRSGVWKFYQNTNCYALKMTKAKSTQAAECLYQEHTFLEVIDHHQIVKSPWHGVVNGHYALVTHWIKGSLLSELCNQNRLPEYFDTQKSLTLFLQSLKSLLASLHSQGIEHRDLWAQNIIVKKNMPFVFDFGWASWTNTPTYTPPKLRQPNDQRALKTLETTLSDLWSTQNFAAK